MDFVDDDVEDVFVVALADGDADKIHDGINDEELCRRRCIRFARCWNE